MRDQRFEAWLFTMGREFRVLPKSHKNFNFRTVADAERRLEQLSRQLGHDAQGRVLDTHTGKLVLTVAL